MNLSDGFRTLLKSGALDLPPVGRGRTAERHFALRDFGREDLSLARVIEAHTDATAILAEADRRPREDALYGVWASDGPKSQVLLIDQPGGELILRGVKQYCSGAAFLNASLVTAHHGDDLLLIDVPLADSRISVDTSSWTSPAFAATATGEVTFRDVPITREQVIGGPGWYLQRAGFWHGALGPAACWAGGAIGLVAAARKARRENPHGLAHLGALEALAWGMTAILDRAGREIDADPLDESRGARVRALSARHLIERSCTEVMDHFGRATGPALLAFDAKIAQRYSELTLYIRQCHAERDLQDLAEDLSAACDRTV